MFVLEKEWSVISLDQPDLQRIHSLTTTSARVIQTPRFKKEKGSKKEANLKQKFTEGVK